MPQGQYFQTDGLINRHASRGKHWQFTGAITFIGYAQHERTELASILYAKVATIIFSVLSFSCQFLHQNVYMNEPIQPLSKQ